MSQENVEQLLHVYEALNEGADEALLDRFIWHGVGHGPDLNMQATVAHTVRKGRIFGIEFFWDQAEALEALGPSE